MTTQYTEITLKKGTMICSYPLKNVVAIAGYKNHDNTEANLELVELSLGEGTADMILFLTNEAIQSAREELISYLYNRGVLLTEHEIADLRKAEKGLSLENDAA